MLALQGDGICVLSKAKACEGRGRIEKGAESDKFNAQLKGNYLNLASEQRIPRRAPTQIPAR